MLNNALISAVHMLKKHDTKVGLIVDAENELGDEKRHNLGPIDVIEKALFDPMQTDLCWGETWHTESGENERLFSLEYQLDVVACRGE